MQVQKPWRGVDQPVPYGGKSNGSAAAHLPAFSDSASDDFQQLMAPLPPPIDAPSCLASDADRFASVNSLEATASPELMFASSASESTEKELLAKFGIN